MPVTIHGLAARAASIGAHLHAGSEQVVAVLLPRSADLAASIMAVMHGGAAFLPIDPANPPARIAFMLQDAGAALVIANGETAALLPACVPVLRIDHIGETAPSATPWCLPPPSPRAAYIIYTSGTTGQPKGVVVTFAGVAGLAAAQCSAFGLTPDSRVLQLASPSFDAMVMELLMVLAAGAAIVLPPPGPLLGEDLQAAIDDAGVTHALITPSALATLPPGATLPSLRTLIVGGEACPGALVARWSPGRRMVNAYGPTEATACVTLSAPLSGAARPGIGRPIPGVRVFVLDHVLQPVPAGVPGELYIAGACLARGYAGRAALTAERFVPCPYGPPGARMYRTGDLVRWRADRTLDFIGRADSQVKLGGVRIELGEVEAALAALPGVAQAAACVRDDAGGPPRLVGYIVPQPGAAPPGEAAWRRLLAARLPDAMLPRAFVTLESLPLTTTGKLDRRALPPPSAAALVLRHPANAIERTGTERALGELFAATLNRSDIDVDANFFDLGGHSLLAVALGRRIRETLFPLFPIAGVYAAPTVAELAALIDARRAPAADLPDLAPDLALPPHLAAAAHAHPVAPPPGLRHVFLTGATGFVGGHVLAALLRDTEAHITCHVRAPGDAEARARLRQSFAAKRLDALWHDDRIDAVAGSLAEPDLGLAQETAARVRDTTNALLHCAAEVDFLHPYASLKAANVGSLLTLLDWTMKGAPKRLHHISTLGAIDLAHGSGEVDESDPLPSYAGLVGGYSQSKYVADTLARRALEAGLPVSIHRLGSVTGDHAHAICNDADFIWRLARFSAALGALPDLDLALNLTPVDDVARAIVRLADRETRAGAVHHLLAPTTPRLADIAEALRGLGVPMRCLPADAWAALALARIAASEDAELAAILAIAARHNGVPAGRAITAAATQARLRALDAGIAPVGPALLARYLRHARIAGAVLQAAE